MINTTQVKKCKKELKELYGQKKKLDSKYEHFKEINMESEQVKILEEQLKVVSAEICDLIENDYAEAVFNEYCTKRPDLIRVRTGETISWNEAFGSDFSKVTKSLRHSLVGLVEEPGRYRIKS